MLAKFISLNAVIRGYICVPIWHALKSVSHSNLLFLATLLRHTSELESKNVRISVSTTHGCVSGKKNSTTQQRASALGFCFFSGEEAGSTSSWPQAIHHLRGLMTQRLRLTASRQFSITSPALLLSQEAETATMKLQMFLSCKMSTLKLQTSGDQYDGMCLNSIAVVFVSLISSLYKSEAFLSTGGKLIWGIGILGMGVLGGVFNFYGMTK